MPVEEKKEKREDVSDSAMQRWYKNRRRRERGTGGNAKLRGGERAEDRTSKARGGPCLCELVIENKVDEWERDSRVSEIIIELR